MSKLILVYLIIYFISVFIGWCEPSTNRTYVYSERDKFYNLDYASKIKYEIFVAPLSYANSVFSAFQKATIPSNLVFTKRQIIEHQKKNDPPYIFIRFQNLGDCFVSPWSRYIVFEHSKQIKEFDSHIDKFGLRDSFRIAWSDKKIEDFNHQKTNEARAIGVPFTDELNIPHLHSPPRVFNISFISRFSSEFKTPIVSMIPLVKAMNLQEDKDDLDTIPFVDIRWLDFYTME